MKEEKPTPTKDWDFIKLDWQPLEAWAPCDALLNWKEAPTWSNEKQVLFPQRQNCGNRNTEKNKQ